MRAPSRDALASVASLLPLPIRVYINLSLSFFCLAICVFFPSLPCAPFFPAVCLNCICLPPSLSGFASGLCTVCVCFSLPGWVPPSRSFSEPFPKLLFLVRVCLRAHTCMCFVFLFFMFCCLCYPLGVSCSLVFVPPSLCDSLLSPPFCLCSWPLLPHPSCVCFLSPWWAGFSLCPASYLLLI